jgi:hypothetical protein
MKLQWNTANALLVSEILSFIFLMAMKLPKSAFYNTVGTFLFGWGMCFTMLQLIFPFEDTNRKARRQRLDGIATIRTTRFSHYLIENEDILEIHDA